MKSSSLNTTTKLLPTFIAFITTLILLSHVSFAQQHQQQQQESASSAESLHSADDDAEDYTIIDSRSDNDHHHHHYELHPPEESEKVDVFAQQSEEELPSYMPPTEPSEPESAPELPSEPPPAEAAAAAQSPTEAQQQADNDGDAQEEQHKEPPTPPETSQPDEPSSSSLSELLAQYTPSLEQSQQTLEALKSNGLLAYDYLESTVLSLATSVPNLLDSDDSGDVVSKTEGSSSTAAVPKRPRENYALLSRFSWSALCQYYASLVSIAQPLDLLLCTETAVIGGVLLLLLVIIIRYCSGSSREKSSENPSDHLPQSSSPGIFSRLLRTLHLTILFSSLASYVDGAFRSLRLAGGGGEAVVSQGSHGHAGVYSMQGRRPNMEDCFTLRNNIGRELGIDYYAVFDGHGGPNAALQAEREIFENVCRRIKDLLVANQGESNKENTNTSPSQEQQQQQQQSLSKSSKSVPSSPTKPTSSSSSSFSESSCPSTPSTASSSSPLTFSSMLNSASKAVSGSNLHQSSSSSASTASHRPFDRLTVNAMKTILHEEITAVDFKLVEAFRRRGDISGTTAVIAVRLLHSNHLLVANVGDSRAVLCDWKGQAIVLSVDHKPYQLKEYRRIVEAGGYIMLKGVYRVNGILAVSRALGDYPLKEDRLVIADPDILSFDLAELRARFMIIASDGFFDCFSNENAVQFVRGELARHGAVNMGDSQAGLALYLAKRLANEAYTRESYDNITIIVVLFEDVAGGGGGGGGGVQVKGVGQATTGPSGGQSSPTTSSSSSPPPSSTSASQQSTTSPTTTP